MRKAFYVILPVLFGLYLGLNELIGRANTHREIEYWKPIVWETTSVVVIMVLVPLIVWFERRHPLESPGRWRTFGMHLAGAIGFSLVHVVGMIAARKLIYVLVYSQTYEYGSAWLTLFYELQKDVITYTTILLIAFTIRQYRRRREGEVLAAELSRSVSDARLRQLTAQIDPHFIFNALNAISNRMHEDVEAADRMLARLADLIRAAYETDETVFVELGREVQLLRGYLDLMAERFRGQLTIELTVEPGIEALRVPRLLIQPIVENALKHGLVQGRGSLRVEIRRDGEQLTCLVTDDGVGIAAPVRMGTGLSNVSHRLELLFPGKHEFRVESAAPGTRVSMAFPVVTA
ncbi:MAG: sensor histidine kinase [Steroidobacterales bacterium]